MSEINYIEPNFNGSNKSNVDKVTILEPEADGNITNNIYKKVVSVMKQSTQEYYNMRMVLGLKCA